jgi:hypothetical protein
MRSTHTSFAATASAVVVLAALVACNRAQATGEVPKTLADVGRASSERAQRLSSPTKDWLRRRAQITSDWMARQVDRPSWVVGWLHDYVNADGSPRVWRPDNRPSDADTSEAGRKVRDGWTFTFRSRHIEAVRDAAWLYRAMGEEHYARWAISQLTFYATHYAQWPLQRRLGLSRLMGQNLDEATVIIQLAQAARAVRPLVSAQEWALWRDSLFVPVADTLRSSVTGLNNISVWQRSALGVVALLLDDTGMWRDAVDGPTGFKALIEQGLTRDGIWYEGSFGYNAYLVRAALPVLQAAAEAGRSAELAAAAQRLRLALTVPLALRFDDNSLPNPGDSTSRIRVPDLPLLAEARTVLPTPWSEAAALRHPGWADVWSPPSANDGTLPPLPAVQSMALPDMSMAVLKGSQPGWQVFAHWGQRTQHHAQREALNLEMYWRGQPVSRDPGTVYYGSPLHNGYFTQPAAHNVPFVNDKGQQGWAPGELLDFDAATSSLSVLQPRYNADAGVDRVTSLSDGRLRDSVKFRVRAGVRPPSSMGLAWHFDCRMTIDDGLAPRPTGTLPAGEGFQHWTDVRAFAANASLTMTLHCPGGALRLRVAAPGPLEVFKARAPSLPAGSFRDAVYLRAPFATSGFESVFAPLVEAAP